MGSTKTFIDFPPTLSSRWSMGCRAIAQGKSWGFLLTVLGSASSAIYPHPPLVSFASIAGVTLTPKKALLVAMAIWLINQVYGYSLRDYPRTIDSFAWGLGMGLGTLLVTLLAAKRPKFSRERVSGHFLWLGATIVGGFVLFEGLILLFGLLLGSEHSLTLSLLGRLFVKEVIWAIALGLGHMFLVRRSLGFN